MSEMGLSIVASGLAADTAELNTASNNLANINTPGYAAEQVNLSAQPASGELGAGQGVIVGSVTRLSDAVYVAANIAAQGVQGAASQTDQTMKSIESIFPEPNSTGLSSQLSTFWTDLSTLASNPNQVGAQQAVVGAAQNVAASISGSFTQLSKLATSLQAQIGAGSDSAGSLGQVNSLLSQVAQLNDGIVAGKAASQNVNSLIDQSTAAINKLAGLLGVSASTEPNGSISVYMNGVQLVQGNVAQSLTTVGSATTRNLAVTTSGGIAVDPGGSIGAGLTAVNSTIPTYEGHLNSIADSLASSVNSLQANGLDSNGDLGSAIAGGYTGTVLPNIFVNGGSSTTYTASSSSFDSAATIAVSPALLANAALIATAAAPGSNNSNAIGTPTLDGSNAQAMAALASSTTGPDAQYQSMIGALGTESANASTVASAASNLATTASNNVSSISGVNMNNEELNVLSAQNAFQAVSKVVNAMTASLQSLIQAV